MACQVDFRYMPLDGKRAEYTGQPKPTGNRRGFAYVSDTRPSNKPNDGGELMNGNDEAVEVDMEAGSDIQQTTRDRETLRIGGKISGRNWKAKQTNRASAIKGTIGKKSWEEKMKNKEAQRKFKVI